MFLKLLGVVLFFTLFFGCSGGSSKDTEGKLTITFTEDPHANLLNPDRGFYDADYALNRDTNYNMFANVLANGYTLVYASLDLEEYNETAELPTALLDTVNKNLTDANLSGAKLIFRIKYRSSTNGNDPARAIILGHLEQLSSLLQRYQGCISVVQAGVIGAWGEWHSFTGEYAEEDPDYKAHRREIIEKLTEIFPDKYIQIRTPMHKEQLFGAGGAYTEATTEGEITAAIAYSADIRAKIGHHNDCVLASQTDMGTYPSDNIAFWKNYVINDSRYTPVGGETCGIGEGEDAVLSSCTNAVAEFKRLQYSYLNDAYHPEVLQKWKDEGCYTQIQENLGYRLVAQELTIEQNTDTISVALTLENKGYAAPYVKSEVNFVLKSSENTYHFRQDIDTRTLYPEEERILRESIDIRDIAQGEYCLYLQIGEGFSAVRLSNRDLWEESSRLNKLACSIVIE